MNSITKYERETLLGFIQAKKWIPVIEHFKDNTIYQKIKDDQIASDIIDKFFVSELITGNSFENDSSYPFYLNQFHTLHTANKFHFKLSTENFKKLTIRLVEQYFNKGDYENAFRYSTEFPKEEICKKAIEKYESSRPKIVSHSQKEVLTISENKNIGKVDKTISIFKSNQEYTFYRALREVYQGYYVFPNVALSALIDLSAINSSLSKEDKEYFLRALVDFVIIDQENGYKPIKFIELDSVFHDTEKQKNKDLQKDKIIALAGHKLFRVRPNGKTTSEEQFIKLIKEAIK